MRFAGSVVRRSMIAVFVAALCSGALLQVEAQSGRKPPEKARKERPDGEKPKPGEAPPQEGPPQKPLTKEELAEAVTLSTAVVNVETVVYEKKSGAILQNMKQANFEIYEDGVKQEITNFAPTQGPMTVVVILEYSKRVDNGWIRKEEVIEPLYVLGRSFVKPDDNIAIVAFDTRPFVVQDFLSQPVEVEMTLTKGDTIASQLALELTSRAAKSDEPNAGISVSFGPYHAEAAMRVAAK